MIADNAIHSGIWGNDWMISMIRWMMVSIRPPKYPAMPPTIMPMKKLRVIPTSPMVSEIRDP